MQRTCGLNRWVFGVTFTMITIHVDWCIKLRFVQPCKMVVSSKQDERSKKRHKYEQRQLATITNKSDTWGKWCSDPQTRKSWLPKWQQGQWYWVKSSCQFGEQPKKMSWDDHINWHMTHMTHMTWTSVSSIFHSLLAPTKRDVDFFFITARFSPAAPGLEEEVLDPHELMGSFLWSPGQGESLWIADKRALNHWDVFWDVASGYDIHRASHG